MVRVTSPLEKSLPSMRLVAIIRGAAATGALTLSCAGVAQAAGGSSAEQIPLHLSGGTGLHATASSSGSSILRTIIALVVVVAIIYAVARILKAVKGRDVVRASGQGLEQLATLPLGPNRSVALVRAGTDIVLVGCAEQGITALKTYTAAEALSSGIDLGGGEPGDPASGERPVDRVLDGLRRMTAR
jgi:flagellar protein FliO/FliZ